MSGTRGYTGTAPGGFAKRPCETCGEIVAHILDGRPVRSHRRGRFHQAAVAKARKEREAGR